MRSFVVLQCAGLTLLLSIVGCTSQQDQLDSSDGVLASVDADASSFDAELDAADLGDSGSGDALIESGEIVADIDARSPDEAEPDEVAPDAGQRGDSTVPDAVPDEIHDIQDDGAPQADGDVSEADTVDSDGDGAAPDLPWDEGRCESAVGFNWCDGACRTNSDPDYCGSGCAACPGDRNGAAICTAGACGLDCREDWHMCGDLCVPDDNVLTCGDRCTVCPVVDNATSLCEEEVCAYECNEGFRRCEEGCCPWVVEEIAEEWPGRDPLLATALDSSNRPHFALICSTLYCDTIDYYFEDVLTESWVAENVKTGTGRSAGVGVAFDLNSKDEATVVLGDRVSGDGELTVASIMHRSSDGWIERESWSIPSSPATVSFAAEFDERDTLHLISAEGDEVRYRTIRDTDAEEADRPESELIASQEGTEGFTVALALDSAGQPHVAYRGDAAPLVSYATRDGSGWRTQIVFDQPDAERMLSGLSIAIADDGTPHIAFVSNDYWAYRPVLVYTHRTSEGDWPHDVLLEGAGLYRLAQEAMTLGPNGDPHIVVPLNIAGSGNATIGVTHLERIEGSWIRGAITTLPQNTGATDLTIDLDSEGVIHVGYLRWSFTFGPVFFGTVGGIGHASYSTN